jgi:hypothetical protein
LWGDLSDAASNDGAEWIYDNTTTASGTAPGRVRLDNTNFANATKIYISRSDRLGHDWYYALNQMLSTNGKIVLRNLVGGAQVAHRAFRITGGSYVNTSGEQRFEYDVTPQNDGPSNLFSEGVLLVAKNNASTTHVYGWTPNQLPYLTSTTTTFNTSKTTAVSTSRSTLLQNTTKSTSTSKSTSTTTTFNTSTTTVFSTSRTTTVSTSKTTQWYTVYNTTTTYNTSTLTITYHNTTTFYNTSRSTFTASGGGCARGCR